MSQLARRSHLHPPPIVPAGDPGVWAPAPKGCLCTDAVGFKRKRHDYSISARDGMRCLHCNALSRMEPVR